MRSIPTLMALAGAVALLSAPPASAQPHRHAARISLEDARTIALERVPGTVQSEEYEFEGHQWIYSFEIVPAVQDRPGIEEVNVNGDTGVVVSVEHEGR
jgi:uncharacterized membrane protein YkoI